MLVYDESPNSWNTGTHQAKRGNTKSSWVVKSGNRVSIVRNIVNGTSNDKY